jgi:hypothetical protein
MAESGFRADEPDDIEPADLDEVRARPVRRRKIRRDDEPVDAAEVLIPYRNGKALAAYYLGVFGLIPCVGNILGPLALIFGILGLRYSKANPRARGAGHAIAGIVFGIIEIGLYYIGPLILVALGMLKK